MSSSVQKKRMTIQSVRRRDRNQRCQSEVPDIQKDVAFQVLRESGLYPQIVAKVSGCSRQYPCNSKWCRVCSNARKCIRKRHVGAEEQVFNGTCNATSTALRTLSPNYRVRAGQRMVSQFQGLPLILLHAITINLTLVKIDDNLAKIIATYRRRLRRVLGRLCVGSIVRGKFDMVLKYADGLEFDISEGDLPRELRGQALPHQRYGMLHVHFVCFDPSLSMEDLRAILVEEFPGKKRVRVGHAYEDVVHADGTVTHGVQGYLEYLSMEKIDLAFGNESVDAILEFAQLDDTWSRANRNFSVGKRTEHTLALIDADRVSELERLHRIKCIRKNFKNLSFAERWLHIWMSDAKKHREAVILSKRPRSWVDLLGRFIPYRCNSCASFERQLSEKAKFLLALLTETAGDAYCPLRI